MLNRIEPSSAIQIPSCEASWGRSILGVKGDERDEYIGVLTDTAGLCGNH